MNTKFTIKKYYLHHNSKCAVHRIDAFDRQKDNKDKQIKHACKRS